MKRSYHPFAFTSIELLLVIAIIAILASMLLPSVMRTKQRANETTCLGNLKQLGTSLISYQHDHGDYLPHQVPTSEGGAREHFFDENGNAIWKWEDQYRIWQCLSNSIGSSKLLICPADKRGKATNFAEMNYTNISYWFFISKEKYNNSATVFWSGDGVTREIYHALKESIPPTTDYRWAMTLYHGVDRGNVLFADGHVEKISNQDTSWLEEK